MRTLRKFHIYKIQNLQNPFIRRINNYGERKLIGWFSYFWLTICCLKTATPFLDCSWLCLSKTKGDYLSLCPRRQLHPSNSQFLPDQHRGRSSHCRQAVATACLVTLGSLQEPRRHVCLCNLMTIVQWKKTHRMSFLLLVNNLLSQNCYTFFGLLVTMS